MTQSQQIRNALRAAREGINDLKELQRAMAKKKKKNEQHQALLAKQQKQIDLLQSYIDNYDEWQKKRTRMASTEGAQNELFKQFQSTPSSDSTEINLTPIPPPNSAAAQLLGSPSSSGSPSTLEIPPDIPSSLLQEEEDISQEMSVIQQNEDLINEGLDQVHYRIRRLHVLATEIGDEITVQNEMLAETTNNIDKAQSHMESVNGKLKKLVKATRSGDKIILDCILLVVLLAIAGFIYRSVSK